MCRQKTGPSGAILVPFLGSLAVQQIEKEYCMKNVWPENQWKNSKIKLQKAWKTVAQHHFKMTRMSGSLEAQYGEMRSDLTHLHSTAHCTKMNAVL